MTQTEVSENVEFSSCTEYIWISTFTVMFVYGKGDAILCVLKLLYIVYASMLCYPVYVHNTFLSYWHKWPRCLLENNKGFFKDFGPLVEWFQCWSFLIWFSYNLRWCFENWFIFTRGLWRTVKMIKINLTLSSCLSNNQLI